MFYAWILETGSLLKAKEDLLICISVIYTFKKRLQWFVCETVLGLTLKQGQNLLNAGFGVHCLISVVPQNILQVADTNEECLKVSIQVYIIY